MNVTPCKCLVYFSVAGADFISGYQTATFKPNATVATVSIPIIDDTVAERKESFNAVVSSASSPLGLKVFVGAANITTVNIYDDDTVSVKFGSAQYFVNEGDGTVTLTLFANTTAAFDYIVEVHTQNGSAQGMLATYLYINDTALQFVLTYELSEY